MDVLDRSADQAVVLRLLFQQLAQPQARQFIGAQEAYECLQVVVHTFDVGLGFFQLNRHASLLRQTRHKDTHRTIVVLRQMPHVAHVSKRRTLVIVQTFHQCPDLVHLTTVSPVVLCRVRNELHGLVYGWSTESVEIHSLSDQVVINVTDNADDVCLHYVRCPVVTVTCEELLVVSVTQRSSYSASRSQTGVC
ncbi:hypothetical protein D3C87_1338790 [compost metagenome]